MNSKTDRILALGVAGTMLWLGVVIAAPTEKKSGKSAGTTNLGQDEIVLELGAPDTEIRNSPSAPPNLDEATASTREGVAPSALIDPSVTDDLPAPTQTSSLYNIDWQSINLGGGTSTSPTYTAFQSVGQEAIGASQGGSYTAGQGFWYGAPTAAGPPSCACDCHGNPVCDAAICDVLDVVAAVTVAFRNGAAIPDPNPNCDHERTDVDCSTFTDVIDVVKIVSVAFRNANPTTEFCTPCP